LILTNAIYFKGKWTWEFDKDRTDKRDFHGLKEDFKIDMMTCNEQKYPYHEEPGLQVADLPYNGDLAMTVFLPETPAGLATLEHQLAKPAEFERLTGSLGAREKVHVVFPKFKVTTEYKLSNTLKTMGAALAFSDAADFSGIGQDPDGTKLKISEVIHKAYVDVTEEGTEAAAATAVIMMRCTAMRPTMEKWFICDRPFIYAIRNVKTGTGYFLGRFCTQP
jgi:serpin B